MINLRKYQEKKMNRDYSVLANGSVIKGDKRLNPNNMSRVSIYSQVYNAALLVYTTFVGNKKVGWVIKRIDTSKGYAVSNLISYPRNDKYTKIVRFFRPYIIKLNKVREYVGIQSQLLRLRVIAREIDENIKRHQVEELLEHLVDMFIVGLQIMLYFGINRSLALFSKKLNIEVEKIDSGYYYEED